MKNIKKVLALALCIISICAVTLPAFAGSTINVGWQTVTAIRPNAPIWPAMSTATTPITYVSFGSSLKVKFDTNSMTWLSAEKDGIQGYVQRSRVDISNMTFRNGSFGTTMYIEQGDKGQGVRNLQMYLKHLGFDPQGIDGIFGNNTYQAVRNFQSANGLGVDGIVGIGTQDKIVALIN